MKQVKKKSSKLRIVLDMLSTHKTPNQISKELNLSKQSISYYLGILKANGNIKKIGYGTWEVQSLTLNTLKSKAIRGHAFIWTVKLNKKFNWKELTNDFKLVRGLIPRIIVLNHKVWLGKDTITVYENKSFYANNSIQSRKYAVLSLLNVIRAIESKLKINLRPYIFKPTREHYSQIKNELARQYNEKGEKMIIRDDLEGDWLWIDDSESLNELETKNIVRSKQVQDWWNDNKKYDFKVTPSFLMETLAIQQNQLNQFTEQIKSHLALIKEYRKENIAWRKSESKKIKDNLNNGTQTNLKQWT